MTPWQEIADAMGISRTRVKQLYAEGMRKVLRACRINGIEPAHIIVFGHALARAEEEG